MAVRSFSPPDLPRPCLSSPPQGELLACWCHHKCWKTDPQTNPRDKRGHRAGLRSRTSCPLKDSRSVLFTYFSDQAALMLQDLKTRRLQVIGSGSNPFYSPT